MEGRNTESDVNISLTLESQKNSRQSEYKNTDQNMEGNIKKPFNSSRLVIWRLKGFQTCFEP